jgi:aspartate racemase
MRHRILGIIVGMGPEATVDLMLRVIKATPGRDEQNHIRMLVDNNPRLPSRIKALQTQDQEARSMVEWMLKDIPSVGEFISTAAKSPTPDRAE